MREIVSYLAEIFFSAKIPSGGVKSRMRWSRAVDLFARRGSLTLLRDNGLFLLVTVIVGITTYLFNTIAARRLAPGDYSQFGIMFSLLIAFSPISGAVSGAVLRRASFNRVHNETNDTPAVQRTLIQHLTLILGAILVLVIVAHAAIGQFLRLTTTVPLYFVLITGYWLIVQGLFQGTLQEEGRYTRLSCIFLGAGVLRAMLGSLVIAAGFGIVPALAMYAVSTMLATLFFPRPRPFWRGVRPLHSVMRPIYRDITQLGLSYLCFILLFELDIVLCRRYLSPLMADQYAAISSLTKFFLFATASICSISFAEVVKATHRGTSSVRPLTIAAGMIAAMGAAFVGVCVVFGPLLMGLLFGDIYRASGQILWIGAVSAFGVSCINLEIAYFNARHWFWYLPVLLLGSIATVGTFRFAHDDVQVYARIYAAATLVLALVLLVPFVLGIADRIGMGKGKDTG